MENKYVVKAAHLSRRALTSRDKKLKNIWNVKFFNRPNVQPKSYIRWQLSSKQGFDWCNATNYTVCTQTNDSRMQQF